LPKIAWLLSREAGVSMAEIARRLGVGPSAIAMAIKEKELLSWTTIVIIVSYVPFVLPYD
jgi:plasmid maintenance system antidote protein VapI